MHFKIQSKFDPTGDQPKAISQLYEGLKKGKKHQVLLGVTGSGKTFTIANVIEKIQEPTLIFVHNKTLAAQLYMEFKDFFPNNAVEYFVSYYNYYQPEAYIPNTSTYIQKDLSINQEIEKLRFSTISALLSGRRDIIVISSVSCIYGLGNPNEFKKNVIKIKIGETITRTNFLKLLVKSLYTRSVDSFNRGNFRVKGDVIDIFPIYSDFFIRVMFFGNQVENIISINNINSKTLNNYEEISIYPANLFVASPKTLKKAIKNIEKDLSIQYKYFLNIKKKVEAKRLLERTKFDLEMMKELGYCSGIENYSRYLDGRKANSRPFCLIDYFPKTFLMIIDESHVTIPQVHSMYSSDLSRKKNLVEYGFRLASAIDNRPLKFDEFETLQNQTIYVSATPSEYELNKSKGLFIEQIIRPTGLLDPSIEIYSSKNQIKNLINEINICKKKNERVIIITLTKYMAEEVTKFLKKIDIYVRYIHSDINTIKRMKIIEQFRQGLFDVLIGVNLLREGLDLPEVSLVAILDADKEGFLRSYKSLTQIAGRAARNINGKVIFYADKITDSMKKTIFETKRRRKIQKKYNLENNIIPISLNKKVNIFNNNNDAIFEEKKIYFEINNKTKEEISKKINELKQMMKLAVKKLNFMEAAKYRDIIQKIEHSLSS